MTNELQLIFGDTNYANVFAINLLAGRMYRNDTLREFVINETARKAYGFKTPQDAIGKRLNFWGEDKVEIVGVMNDFHQRSLKSEMYYQDASLTCIRHDGLRKKCIFTLMWNEKAKEGGGAGA